METVSFDDDAYERLEAEKREGEDFSDVVRRLTADSSLEAYYGALSAETADELEVVLESRRE